MREVNKKPEGNMQTANKPEFSPEDYIPLKWHEQYNKPIAPNTEKETRLKNYAKAQNMGSGLLTLAGLIGGAKGYQLQNTDPSKYNFAYMDELAKNRTLANQGEEEYNKNRFNILNQGYQNFQARKAKEAELEAEYGYKNAEQKRQQDNFDRMYPLQVIKANATKQNADTRSSGKTWKPTPGMRYIDTNNGTYEYNQTNYAGLFNIALNALKKLPNEQARLKAKLSQLDDIQSKELVQQYVAEAIQIKDPETIKALQSLGRRISEDSNGFDIGDNAQSPKETPTEKPKEKTWDASTHTFE